MPRAEAAGGRAPEPERATRCRWRRLTTPARLHRLVVGAAALVCLLYVATLRDLRWAVRDPAPPPSPVLPAHAGARDAALRLQVVDPDGQPIVGATAQVFAIVDDLAYWAGQGRTGADGKVSIGELPRGETWLLVHGPEHARTSSRFVLEQGERELTVTLEPARFFEVVTVDTLQRPIAGVRVRLFGADPLAYEAWTDAQGLARLTHLGPPPYAVQVVAKGYDTKFLPSLSLEDSPAFVKLERLGALEITVLEPGPDEGGAGGPAAAEPAAGATVAVAGSALWPARTAVTDERGRVTISGLPRGFYDLKAVRDQLVSDTEVGVLLERGETKQVVMALIPGTTITVKVTDGEGPDAPGIPKADVALVEGGISSFPLYGRTDGKGTVRLGPLAGTDATVSAHAEGFVARSAVPVEEGQTEVQIALTRGGIIVGRVVDDRDYPIEGASIEVLGIDLDGMPIAESSAITDFREDHFAFALPGAIPLVPAGELGVMPIVPDIPSDTGPLVVRRTQRSGAPWVSGADGAFKLEPVPPGRVHLVVRHPDYVETITETVRLDVGKEVEVLVVMHAGGLLEGRVVEADHSPAGGARVELAALEGSLERVTYAADDGTFAFAAVPERVLLSVARADTPEHVVSRTQVKVPSGETTEVEIVLPDRRDTVLVRVSDDRGYPLDRVEVRSMSVDPAEPLRKTLFTNDAGEAVLHDARGLPLRVVLLRPGQAPLATQIERAPQILELSMGRAMSARGEVRDRQGPLAGAAITMYTPTGVRHARSDEQGEFLVHNLAPTAVRVLVHKPGYAPLEDLRRVEGDERRPAELGTFELRVGGLIEGEVLDAEEEPIAGARVAVGRVPSYLPLGQLPLGVTSTDRSGRFVLRDIEPGTVAVEAYLIGAGRQAVGGVVVRAGDTTQDVRIVLEEDEEPVRVPEGAGSLAVTLSDKVVGGQRVVEFVHVPPGGEAERAGIEPGDQLLAFNGTLVRSIGQARRKLNGPLSEDFVLLLGRAPDLRWLVRVRRERLRR